MACLTNCPKCGTCYEESSEEQANSPARVCMNCWMAARTEENLRPVCSYCRLRCGGACAEIGL